MFVPADGEIKTSFVFGRVAARFEKRAVDQLDQDPLIHVGFNRVGDLDQLARAILGISERSVGGVFTWVRLCSSR
jgi:hypothetical protein